MKSVIGILESIGEGSSTAEAIRDLMGSKAGAEIHVALQTGDAETLRQLMGCEPTRACLIFTPDENDEPQPDRRPEDDEPASPDTESRVA